jgi:carboxylesterase
MDNTSILLIHGFAGTRNEIRPLYDYLCDKGFDVYMPVLAGHEGTQKELSASKYRHWIESVEIEYEKLSQKGKNIIVVGFSMGGLIAVHLFDKFQFEKLVFVNTPIYYWDVKKILGNIWSDLLKREYSNMKRYFKSGTDKPLKTLIQFAILLKNSKQKLVNIKCDTLILQSKNDDTVKASSAEYLFNSLQGQKDIKYYNGGNHQILNSEISNLVCEDIYKFITNQWGDFNANVIKV